MSGIDSSTYLWYASRATGVVALLLLTVVLLLGILVTRQRRLPGLPRFATTGLHRNLSLLALVFVVLHVVTAVTDGFVSIPLTAAVVPLTSGYERLWLGLGAVSLDLMLAAVVTSLLRGRMPRRAWLAVHLTAYLSWPVAWVHSMFAGSDLQHGVLLALAVACAAAVTAAAVWRLAARPVPRSERVGRQLAAAQHDRPPVRPQPGSPDQTPGRERTLSR